MEIPTTEIERITVELPKAIMDFLRDQREDIEKYLQCSIVNVFHADLDNGLVFDNYNPILQRYGLKSVFRAFKINC